MIDRSKLLTEQRLDASMRLDAMTTQQIVDLMHQQDRLAVEAVGRVREQVAQAADLVVAAFEAGGRLFYVGAGTSGRLGVLDAAECPPTFRTDPSMVQGIIAGGKPAMFQAQEGAEDNAEAGASAMDEHGIASRDVVVGIAAGGTTPFVHGALRHARELGAKTVFITCVGAFSGEPDVDVTIRLLVGPEVLTGSTRLKAGTATKLVLNMLSTAAMVRLGKCYENLMVDLRATNSKLWDRGARIISILTGLDTPQAMDLLRQAQGHVKAAVVMDRLGVSYEQAVKRLEAHKGRLREAIESSDEGGIDQGSR